jgi:hypothetical protein
MDQARRLEVATLIDSLTSSREAFSSEVAERLCRLLPLTKPNISPISIGISNTSEGSEALGLTSTGHNMNASTEREQRFRFGQSAMHRCGLYKIVHRPGRVDIEHLFAETIEDQDGQACRLVYRVADFRPIRLLLQKEISLTIAGFRLSLKRFVNWKRPSAP